MASRLELQKMLEEILGSRNVYFQPPSSIKMKYPAIVYSLDRIDQWHSDNDVHMSWNGYNLTYIDSNPDNENVNKLSKLPRCRFDRFYTSDNLNHYTFTLYY